MQLIKASAADALTIQSLAHRIWPDTFGKILSPAQIEYMLEMMYSSTAIEDQMEKNHQFHLLMDWTTAIGYVSHQVDYLPKTTKIHKLYVLPAKQGGGFGRMMIEFVKNIATSLGQQKLRLDVNYENAAIGFYEHLGFAIIGRFDTEIGNGYLMEDYIMEMELTVK